MSAILPPPRLETYLARNLITARQHRGGAAWHGDWITSGRNRSKYRMDGVVDRAINGNGELDIMDSRRKARDRYVEASHRMAGPLLACAQQVILHDVDPTDWAETAGSNVNPRSGMDVLRIALDVLADAYGISRPSSGLSRRRHQDVSQRDR